MLGSTNFIVMGMRRVVERSDTGILERWFVPLLMVLWGQVHDEEIRRTAIVFQCISIPENPWPRWRQSTSTTLSSFSAMACRPTYGLNTNPCGKELVKDTWYGLGATSVSLLCWLKFGEGLNATLYRAGVAHDGVWTNVLWSPCLSHSKFAGRLRWCTSAQVWFITLWKKLEQVTNFIHVCKQNKLEYTCCL